ncbi:hypothetical protein M6B38_206590 [Iris pallida]|uniref:Uncharacterized protein n=1 Tax=Iris pallida TaxID=29817 RepID=A0AAX6E6E9_IRIPA|nr:hypothetical protein M6B38_206590 [Iris pallida]
MELLIKFVNILSKMISISNILLSLCYYIIIIKKKNKSFYQPLLHVLHYTKNFHFQLEEMAEWTKAADC